jgi:hypothetical protein
MKTINSIFAITSIIANLDSCFISSSKNENPTAQSPFDISVKDIKSSTSPTNEKIITTSGEPSYIASAKKLHFSLEKITNSINFLSVNTLKKSLIKDKKTLGKCLDKNGWNVEKTISGGWNYTCAKLEPNRSDFSYVKITTNNLNHVTALSVIWLKGEWPQNLLYSVIRDECYIGDDGGVICPSFVSMNIFNENTNTYGAIFIFDNSSIDILINFLENKKIYQIYK